MPWESDRPRSGWIPFTTVPDVNISQELQDASVFMFSLPDSVSFLVELGVMDPEAANVTFSGKLCTCDLCAIYWVVVWKIEGKHTSSLVRMHK